MRIPTNGAPTKKKSYLDKVTSNTDNEEVMMIFNKDKNFEFE